MECFKCGEMLDFASNPLGKVIRVAPNDIRMYCKPCVKKLDDMFKNVDVTVLEDD